MNDDFYNDLNEFKNALNNYLHSIELDNAQRNLNLTILFGIGAFVVAVFVILYLI